MGGGENLSGWRRRNRKYYTRSNYQGRKIQWNDRSRYAGVEGASRTNIQAHFVHCPMKDTIVILEEGNLPHPICLDCDIIVPWTALNWCHSDTFLC